MLAPNLGCLNWARATSDSRQIRRSIALAQNRAPARSGAGRQQRLLGVQKDEVKQSCLVSILLRVGGRVHDLAVGPGDEVAVAPLVPVRVLWRDGRQKHLLDDRAALCARVALEAVEETRVVQQRLLPRVRIPADMPVSKYKPVAEILSHL